MWMLTVSIVTCTLLLHVTSATNIAETVPELNISQLLGRWYQVYGSYESVIREQRGCVCVNTAYTLLPNKSISVQNSCGNVRVPRGYAYRPDDNEQGKLKVVFPSLFIPAEDYWVIQLGPPTFDGNFYQYVAVSNKCKVDLFVIVRDIAEFKRSYEEEVLNKLKEQGFTRFHNKPREVYQGSDCEYIDVQ